MAKRNNNPIVKAIQPLLFFLILGGVLLLSDRSNRKQNRPLSKKHFDISIVHWIDAPCIDGVEAGIYSGLKECGLEPGKNLQISVLKASGDISILNSIFRQIQAQRPDLVFVSCTPALQSAVHNLRDIPVVFTAVADPILAGAGTDRFHHAENITGCNVQCDFETMCRIITENAPNIKTLGSVFCPGEIISVKFRDEFLDVARKYGLNVQFFPANNASELTDAIIGMTSSRIDAVCQIGDNLIASGISTLIRRVDNAGMPYFDFNPRPSGTPMVSLVQIDVDYVQNGFDAALKAAEILIERKSPADLPFDPPSKVSVQLNPAKAETFGITFNEATLREASFIEGKHSQPFRKTMKLAMVHYISAPDCHDVENGILHHLTQMGHKEGVDYTLDRYNANADIATLNDIVKLVSQKNYDLIFTTVLASAQALAAKIKDTPVLFTVVADPVGNGLGASYNDHLPNLTGIDGMCFTQKGIDLVKQYLPTIQTVGVLFCPGEMASLSGLRDLEASCRDEGLELISLPVNAVGEVIDATTALCMKKVDAICQLPDNMTIPGFMGMVKTTRKHQVPLFCFITSQVQMGAVAAIAGDFFQQGIEIADMALDVLGGTPPADIPFRRIRQIQTVINPEAARAYGLETPQSLLDSVGVIIQ